jgi:filamentous hemagglutinin family protein
MLCLSQTANLSNIVRLNINYKAITGIKAIASAMKVASMIGQDKSKQNQSGRVSLFATAIALTLTSSFYVDLADAQIVPDGSTATQVLGNQILPSAASSLRGGNLYHSFDRFNVPTGGVVFGTGAGINGSAVNNIINRVTGTNASVILGAIQSRAAFPNANLFLLNPNGIVFGTDARLDIGGSFHGSTATGLRFENQDVFGIGTSQLPLGNPAELLFGAATPAGIVNQANLQVRLGQNITLTGGNVLSTGRLDAPNGTVGIATVAGGSKVELRSPDAILSLRIEANAVEPNWQGKITQLPQLARQLTGIEGAPEANQVVVNADGSLGLTAAANGIFTFKDRDGKVVTTGSLTVEPGDALLNSVNAGTLQVTGKGNLVLISPQLSTTGNLSLATSGFVIYRDSPKAAANILSAGNVTIQGDRGIDLWALNHTKGVIQSGGVISLLSNGRILADVTFVPENNVFSSNLNGEPAVGFFGTRR